MLAGCGGTDTGTSGTTTTSTGGDGGTTGSGGMTGGTGGMTTGGTGGGMPCTPGAEKACYSGPDGTQDVGPCKAGVQTCKANGEGFGPCNGEVVPTTETCETPIDDDCDGMVNEDGAGCSCTPGAVESCYGGPVGTENIGACKGGMRMCLPNGTGFGPCDGQVLPAIETCATPVDDDCDGMVNEDGAGCACAPGAMQPCYTGPAGTIDVGLCKAGVQTCNDQGTGYGACVGDITPVTESCLTPGDEDCNGLINEGGIGCVCAAGMPTSCYTGPAGTEGVGLCKPGTAMCSADGTSMGPCVGDVVPALETCATPGDDNCNGVANESGPGCGCQPGTQQVCYTGPAGTLGVGTCKSGMAVCQANGMDFGPCVGQVVPAVEVCSTALEEDCKVGPDCGAASWLGSFGVNGQQQAYSVAVGGGDDVIIAGGFTVVLPLGGSGPPPLFSAGGSDAFVAKFDTSGIYQWALAFGDASMYQEALAVATDAQGNIYVVGDFDGTINFGGNTLTSAGLIDGFLAKLSPTGVHLWSKRFGTNGPQVLTHVAVDSAGNVIVLGKGQSSIDFGGGVLTSAGGMDVFLAKFDSNGNHVFSKRFGGATDDQPSGLAVAGTDILVSITTDGGVDFGGGNLASAGSYDIMLGRLTGAGAHVYSKKFGDGTNQVGSSLAVDAMGNALLTGRIEGTIQLGGAAGNITATGMFDGFLAKLDTTGNGLWVKQYGGAGVSVIGNGVATGANGDVVVTGSASGAFDFGGGMTPVGGGNDFFTVRYDSTGKHLWSVRGGDAANQVGASVAIDSAGNVPVAGYIEGNLMLEGASVTSLSVYDVLVGKLGN
jgi:hypothetical protein